MFRYLKKLCIEKANEIKIAFSIILITGLFIVHTSGVSLADEGYILQAGQRLALGELPFKDFFIAYTPVSAFLTAGSFLIFGESIISSRLLALTISLATCFFIYKLTKLIAKNDAISYLAVIIFVVWGPMHTNFSWPVIYTNLFSVLACYLLLQGQRVKKIKYIFLAGLFVSLTLLAKQNFGVAIIITAISLVIQQKKLRSKKNILNFVLGFVLPVILLVLYILWNNIWPYFIENYYFFFFKKLILDGNGTTPFISFSNTIKDSIKLLFYLSPLLISIPALYYAYVKKRDYLFLPFFVVLYYLFGIRPVTDFVHLTPLLAFSGLSFAVILTDSKNHHVRYSTMIIVVLFIVVGFYSALFRGYYRWETPILNHTQLLYNKRMSIKVDVKHRKLLEDIDKYVVLNTQKGDYVFVNHYIPSLNFIINRRNPTRFIYLHPNVLDYKYQLEIENDLISKNVKLVITEKALENDESHLTKFIKDNYKKDKVMHNYIFWLKNE